MWIIAVWDKYFYVYVFLCNRCEEGAILDLNNSPFLALSQCIDAS